MDGDEIGLDQVQDLARGESPDLVEAIFTFLEAGDPEPDTVPEGAIRFDQLLRIVRNAKNQWRDPHERKAKINEAWSRFLAQTEPPLPPRFALAELIVHLYRKGSDGGRAAVMELAAKAPLRYGVWGGLKRVFKLAEKSLDAEMFAALAVRFDDGYANVPRGAEVGRGTLLYLRRRGWRFLRNLGKSVPALYPRFAVEVLRAYPPQVRFNDLWIAQHIWAHKSRYYDQTNFFWNPGGSDPEEMIKNRAFDEAWKRDPGPLMYLLETAQADLPARFAIQGLRKDFPASLRSVSPAWLDRLARRPLASVHDFLVETLQSTPELHQGRLKGIGLHDTVISLLVSPSPKARAYAIEYARGHAQDLPGSKLVELIEQGFAETTKFALELLTARPPKDTGYSLLGRLLSVEAAKVWATRALDQGFDRRELPESFLRDMLFSEDDDRRSWLQEWLKAKFQPKEIGVDFWKRAAEDARSRDDYEAFEIVQEGLESFSAPEIGAPWLFDRIDHPMLGDWVQEFLQGAESLPGLDVERVKGLVFGRRYRSLALELLGNPKIVQPRQIGLGWLLALARREDATLHEWAHRYLLEHMEPADFGEAGKPESGVTRLFELALGKSEPEPVRLFAQTYLRCHHPVLGPEQPESKQLQLQPKVAREAYSAQRVWSALFDDRADVRRFAVAVTRVELRRWGMQGKIYELAESDAKEVRNVAYDALLRAGDPNADTASTLLPEEIDAVRVFAMTESRIRGTREIAMDLIRRHYARLGGPTRLAWLMESADRTVRLLAVRLLWEKHRPRAFPATWKPRPPVAPVSGAGGAAMAIAASAPVAAIAAAEEEEEEEEEVEEEESEEESEDEASEDEDSDDEDSEEQDSEEQDSEDEDSEDEDSEDEEGEGEGEGGGEGEGKEGEESEDDDSDDDEDSDSDDDDSDEESGGASSAGGGDEPMDGVRCPNCKWVPKKSNSWQCSCGHVWNTFDTRAKCPGCGKQWEQTACLSCGKMSAHADWWFLEAGASDEDESEDEESGDEDEDEDEDESGDDEESGDEDEDEEDEDDDDDEDVEDEDDGDDEEDDEDEEDEEPAPSGRRDLIASVAARRSAPPKGPPPPPDYDPVGGYAGPFPDLDALRDFLRRVLFGLPPGRSMEPRDDVGVRRHLPANVAKRNAIEVVRDLAIEDAAFAKLVVPVLSEFTGSIAKAEWQGCLAALAAIRRAHGERA